MRLRAVANTEMDLSTCRRCGCATAGRQWGCSPRAMLASWRGSVLWYPCLAFSILVIGTNVSKRPTITIGDRRLSDPLSSRWSWFATLANFFNKLTAAFAPKDAQHERQVFCVFLRPFEPVTSCIPGGGNSPEPAAGRPIPYVCQ